jgi:hypothetical protein
LTDEDRFSFLDDLDRSDLDITEWEADFISSIFERRQETFSFKQREVIDKMIEKYESRL